MGYILCNLPLSLSLKTNGCLETKRTEIHFRLNSQCVATTWGVGGVGHSYTITHSLSVMLISLNLTSHTFCCVLLWFPLKLNYFDKCAHREEKAMICSGPSFTHTLCYTLWYILIERSGDVCKLSFGRCSSLSLRGFLLLLWQYCWSLKTIKLVELRTAGGNYRQTETENKLSCTS